MASAASNPTSWVDVQREFSKHWTRQEMADMRKKFQSFDEDNQAMEKMKVPQTHVQLKEMMQEMATDPDKGVTLRDFFAVMLKMKGGDSAAAGQSRVFVQALTDYTPKSIINFHEQKAQQEREEIERERKIKAEAEERKAKAREKQEAKKNFKNKLAMFEQMK